MDFADVITSRKSIRDYANKAVEEEKLTQILEAARWAPSWANRQCARYIVVKDKARIEKICGKFSWIKQAPVVIVACADPKESGFRNGMDYYLVDVGIALQQLVLAASNLGLGTCWIGAFDEASVKAALGVPGDVKVVALTPLGYPAEDSEASRRVRAAVGADQRKNLEEIVHKEKW
ncbi:MAG: nitroreductase family protein [Candidatus Bathyarchaeota archaeon]|nr:nitroreductase family protein [Candidatus Bathyarchaeota archaeon]